MNEWREITTLAELEAFLNVVGGFHDGLVKEVHWMNQDDVRADLSMSDDGRSDARILVQRQWSDPSAVEIVFERVWNLTLEAVGFVSDSSATMEPRPVGFDGPPLLLALDMDGNKVVFERMRWRDASDWMGSGFRFGDFDVPLPRGAD